MSDNFHVGVAGVGAVEVHPQCTTTTTPLQDHLQGADPFTTVTRSAPNPWEPEWPQVKTPRQFRNSPAVEAVVVGPAEAVVDPGLVDQVEVDQGEVTTHRRLSLLHSTLG